MSKYLVENVAGVHIPSFLLGLLGSILLYFLSPGIALVLGGLLSFFRFLVICGGVVGVGYFAYMNRAKLGQINYQDGNNDVGRKSVAAHEVNIGGNTKNGGEFKYFDIPVTRLNQGTPPTLPPRSIQNSPEAGNQRYDAPHKENPRRKVIEELNDDETDPMKMNESINLDIMGSKTQVRNRNERYSNFVNMAGGKR
ncbi:hypothetical protein DAKH74_010890 [Maudiozyma humilis]|uniref:Uncharacterized protein n=1 Tax=Maudiozyma humilis TaxID=51915 RepID=A0AAV5RTB5_MAUHU|nr:hypothetical protein DAKH74_010890 [Kazachstania humilis]